jgi:hypothetical protein
MTTFAQPETSSADALKAEIQAVIVGHANNAPRSLQNAIGPSEIGTDCVRRLGYKIAGVAPTNTSSDPWASISGTSIHGWLEGAFGADPDRWLVETRVQITQTLAGSVDLYDRLNRRVIDHKTSGATGMKKYKSTGPTPQQLIQINLYAYGLTLAGYPVDEVALVYYPLGGRLSGMHTWIGTYDVDVAMDALTRFDNIRALTVSLDADTQPGRLSLLPATATRLCAYCPNYLFGSTDIATGCPGDSSPLLVPAPGAAPITTPISNTN